MYILESRVIKILTCFNINRNISNDCLDLKCFSTWHLFILPRKETLFMDNWIIQINIRESWKISFDYAWKSTMSLCTLIPYSDCLFIFTELLVSLWKRSQPCEVPSPFLPSFFPSLRWENPSSYYYLAYFYKESSYNFTFQVSVRWIQHLYILDLN